MVRGGSLTLSQSLPVSFQILKKDLASMLHWDQRITIKCTSKY
jgi:hypothetical protein